MDITQWPHTHFLAFYSAAMDRALALNCATYSGTYSLVAGDGRSSDARREGLQSIEVIESEKAELRAMLKKEKNMGKQVDLNTRMRELNQQLDTLAAKL